MNTPVRKYWVNINVVAGFMVGTFFVAALVGSAVGGLSGFAGATVLWAAYFAIGWFLDGFNSLMFRLYEKEQQTKPSYPDVPLVDDRTGPFLFWPIFLVFTGAYIPLVLFLRNLFRADPN